MNKVVKSIIVAIILVLVAVSSVFITYYVTVMNSADNSIAIIINEGNEAMNNYAYESAIQKYNEALDMEPENKELKDAIAHAYVMLGKDLGNTAEAITAYQNALTYNQLNTNAYWGMAGVYEANGDEDNMLLTLQTGYVNTEDMNMKVKADNIEIERARVQAEAEAAAAEEAEKIAIENAHNDVLAKLYELFSADEPNIDDVKEMIRTEEFTGLVDEVIGKENSFYYGDRDDTGKRSGKGLAVYENGYFYYGDFKNDMRDGEGIYVRAVYTDSSSLGSYIFEGVFSNDKPNGKGTATSNYYNKKIGASGLVKQVIEGEFVDGLENGEMSLTGTTKTGTKVKYSYKVENGVAVQSSNENSGISGQYIIAKSSDGKSNLTSDGSTRGVEGFIE